MKFSGSVLNRKLYIRCSMRSTKESYRAINYQIASQSIVHLFHLKVMMKASTEGNDIVSANEKSNTRQWLFENIQINILRYCKCNINYFR